MLFIVEASRIENKLKSSNTYTITHYIEMEKTENEKLVCIRQKQIDWLESDQAK